MHALLRDVLCAPGHPPVRPDCVHLCRRVCLSQEEPVVEDHFRVWNNRSICQSAQDRFVAKSSPQNRYGHISFFFVQFPPVLGLFQLCVSPFLLGEIIS